MPSTSVRTGCGWSRPATPVLSICVPGCPGSGAARGHLGHPQRLTLEVRADAGMADCACASSAASDPGGLHGLLPGGDLIRRGREHMRLGLERGEGRFPERRPRKLNCRTPSIAGHLYGCTLEGMSDPLVRHTRLVDVPTCSTGVFGRGRFIQQELRSLVGELAHARRNRRSERAVDRGDGADVPSTGLTDTTRSEAER